MVVGCTRTRVGERERMLSLCKEGVWPARRISMLSVGHGGDGFSSMALQSLLQLSRLNVQQEHKAPAGQHSQGFGMLMHLWGC